MGLFTDISAALSFNFGGKDLPDEFYDHLYERDRTEEQKKLLKFLENKFGIRYKVVEDIINTINKYTNDYDNIPYDKIMHETGYQKDDLIMGAQAIKEYLAQDENIDHAVNNITSTHCPAEKALQELGGLLELLDKKITGDFGPEEKRILEDNTERWKKDIEILRDHIEQKIEKN